MRDVLLAAGDDIQVVPLLRAGVKQQWPGLAVIATRLFGELTEVDEDHLCVPGDPLAGVVTFADGELELAAAIGEHLGVRHRGAAAADKLTQRTVLRSAGLTAVAARSITAAADFDTVLAEFGLPFVVKPRRGAGGDNVTIVDNPDKVATLKGSWRPEQALYAEQFIPTAAPEADAWHADYVSVEVQSVDGRHDVITTFGKFPVHVRENSADGKVATTGDILPCHLPASVRREVEDLVIGAHRVLPIGDGVTHTEVKLGAAGPEIIEINCRVGGHLNRLTKLRSGFDLVRQALLITAGLPPQDLPADDGERAVAGMFVPFPTEDGTVRSNVTAAALKDAGAAAVDEIARQGAARSDTDALACNVVLDRATAEDLRQTAAGFLVRLRELFAEDAIGHHDWTETMITRLGARDHAGGHAFAQRAEGV
ncbi:ATP-grasp domain-containing protein [Actinokineospora xionganensis]|uniref:ATP-grasp domain-containing protein n=1 Tax=Actinokineospora xionganensis TaxID=2684470 RepID=A0ABR7L411_9PSEU|nr:hypothetical protein [Actinokineospora xionganensis]MBC6447421.1 hypothetical protein [Actinokineospora xionganensis]